MERPNRLSRFIHPAFILLTALASLIPGTSTAQNATPIAVTGWNKDTIFEVPATPNAPSSVSQYFEFYFPPNSCLTWAETGVITGKTVYGLPNSRTFTSNASSAVTGGATNTQFQMQPYNAPNSLYLGGAGSGTLTLVTPAKYRRISILNASASSHANLNWINVTLFFTDHAPVDVNLQIVWDGGYSTFAAEEWGSFPDVRAITMDRVFHPSTPDATAADPLTGTQGGFSMSEFVLDMSAAPYDLKNYTLSAVYFNKRYGYSDTIASIFALSGVPVAQVPAGPVILSQSGTQTKCVGETATFTAAASGFPTPTVQWQVSTNGGGSFGNLAGQTSTTLSFAATLAQHGTQYRAVFTNNQGSAISDPAVLAVNALPNVPTVTPSPTAVFANSQGNQASGPAGAASYAWTITNGTITAGANNRTITYTAGASGNVTLSLTIANVSGCQAANSVNVAINPVPAFPSVTLHPLSQQKCEGETVTFTAAATGGPVPTAQWQVSTNGGGSFSNLSGQTGGSLSFTTTLAQSGNQYRAVFSNVSGNASSNPATLAVDLQPPTPAIAALPKSVLAQSTGNQATGPAGAASYEWAISNGALTSAANARVVTYQAGTSGSVTLQLTVGNGTGCTASGALNVAIVTLPPTPGAAATPLALTGWNKDLIFEVPTSPELPSNVTQYFDIGSNITFAETGVITSRTVNGLPTSRTFVSAAFTNSSQTTPTNTQFAFQPYNGPNGAWLGTSTTVTLNLSAPAKYRSLNFLHASSRSQGDYARVLVKLYFSDRAPVQIVLPQYAPAPNVAFTSNDWGSPSFPWEVALTADRVFHSATLSATPADPLQGTQAGFKMSESVIDLTQAPYQLDSNTLTSIELSRPAGTATTTVTVFAVSGTPKSLPPSLGLKLTDFALDQSTVSFIARGLVEGRGYLIQRSPNLFDWQSIDAFAADTPDEPWSEPRPTGDSLYYRLLEY